MKAGTLCNCYERHVGAWDCPTHGSVDGSHLAAPQCDQCGRCDRVSTGPGFPASEHWCARCDYGWMEAV
jgi:hypothetical protein